MRRASSAAGGSKGGGGGGGGDHDEERDKSRRPSVARVAARDGGCLPARAAVKSLFRASYPNLISASVSEPVPFCMPPSKLGSAMVDWQVGERYSLAAPHALCARVVPFVPASK